MCTGVADLRTEERAAHIHIIFTVKTSCCNDDTVAKKNRVKFLGRGLPCCEKVLCKVLQKMELGPSSLVLFVQDVKEFGKRECWNAHWLCL